tara:strand:+ start:5304 stop:5495 length:192 start_codon:yes stop_codon:yes gene_type:complete
MSDIAEPVEMTIWLKEDINQEEGKGARFETCIEAINKFREIQDQLSSVLIEFNGKPIMAWDAE